MMDLMAHLQTQELFGLSLTLGAYAAAVVIWSRCNKASALHPVLIGTVIVATVLLLTDLEYGHYLDQTEVLNHGLAAIVVLALAVPIVASAPLTLSMFTVSTCCSQLRNTMSSAGSRPTISAAIT